MSTTAIIATLAAYFGIFLLISWISGRKTDNAGFFNGNRKSEWWIVALAMISSSMSGVTFVSVPGMVGYASLGYLQMCLGFIVGYFIIAYILAPLFYKIGVISIYQYLEKRFGISTYKTGAWFFFISKMLGASVRLFLVCLILQLLIFEPLGIGFTFNVLFSIVIVLLYTFKGGVKSVISTDILKTFSMLTSIVLTIIFIAKGLNLSFKGLVSAIYESDMSGIFFFDDPKASGYFWKQFMSGIFIVVAMTGLDQDMMQRTLSCKNLKESQKNLITSTFLQTIVIFIFLCLGVLLYIFAKENGIAETGDKIFPSVATSSLLPPIVGVFFIIGLVSCAYSAGGSALTSLTTSFTIDILGISNKSEKSITTTRYRVHIAMAILMYFIILIFNLLNNTSAIDAVYRIASYTYGPLLGMFTFGIFTKRKVRDKLIPVVAIAAPLICLILQINSEKWFSGYKFGYEILIYNAAITFLGMILLSSKQENLEK
ncbi:MAG: sodium:solute symporter [Candidatus Cryptobacteroides sp.]